LLSESVPCVRLLRDKRNGEVDTCLEILPKTTVENSPGGKIWWCETSRKLLAAVIIIIIIIINNNNNKVLI